MTGKHVIINGDDFGFSPAITAGILQAHRDGVLTSTTLASNMPAAAEAVAQLVDAPDLGVGVHLNASQGPPLSDAGRDHLAGADGQMAYTGDGLLKAALFRRTVRDALEAEFDAQIQWAIDHGVRPTHLDSHRHCHGLPVIFKRVIRLARRYDIAFVRRYRETLPGRDWPEAEDKQRRVSKWLNRFGRLHSFHAKGRLATTGTWGIRHTGLIDAAWLTRAAQRLPEGVTEIMTHPGLADDLPDGHSRLGDARPGELAALCDPRVRDAFERAGVRRIHYGHLLPAKPV